MMTQRLINYLALFSFLLFGFVGLQACEPEIAERAQSERTVEPPDWAVNANIYEVNIRQFSEEGTFNAFAEEIPRLHDMGVKILWLMPIHPIGEENRKGTLGSYYSVMDFTDVNPEFGTKEDLKNLVETAHDHDMKVILDWVANHTAWDNVWTETNPEFFETDEDGNFFPPVPDWEDVIQLDYENPELREEMIQAMEYWVRDYGIDGYRCDVAYMVPTDFWNDVRQRLDQIKPVFMLAEAEEPELHEQAFDMSYAWDYAQIIRDIGAGIEELSAIDANMEREKERFHINDYRMYFTTNHDENSWQGSDPELFGSNFENFAVMSATINGMPLIYNGQESGLNQQLEFFEKDPIEWGELIYEDFYRMLLELNTNNSALWNGRHGGEFVKVPTDRDDVIYSYKRVNDEDRLFVVLNFSDEDVTFYFDEPQTEEWTDVMTGQQVTPNERMTLPAHWYLLLEN